MSRRRDPRIKAYQLKNGRTRYKVVVSLTVQGQYVQRVSRFDTITAAEDWIKAQEAAATRGEMATAKAASFNDVADAFLLSKKNAIRPSTLKNYTSALGPYRTAFGKKKITDVTLADIEAVVNQMAAAGLTQRTVAAGIGVVSQVFKRAIKEGRTMMNPAVLVESKGKESARPTAFTSDELARITTVIDRHEWGHAFALILRGLRRSEVMALEWSDIDLTAKTLTISKSRTIAGPKATHTGPPKTQNGYRTLPLDDDLAKMLKAAKKRQGVIVGHVVVDELGRPLYPERISDEWAVILQSAEVPYRDLRAARRSSVTHMRDQGIKDHIVARWHGHDESVMRKFYSVSFETELQTAGETMAGVFRKSS